MQFFKDIVSSKSLSGASSKRFVLVIAGCSLSLSSIVLSVAACFGIDVEMALWAITTPLCAMAGVSYVGKKEVSATEDKPGSGE